MTVKGWLVVQMPAVLLSLRALVVVCCGSCSRTCGALRQATEDGPKVVAVAVALLLVSVMAAAAVAAVVVVMVVVMPTTAGSVAHGCAVVVRSVKLTWEHRRGLPQ
jgi:hypothetical protein